MNGETIRDFKGAARTHIALGVSDVDRSARFYGAMLGVLPVKLRPGYAKFEVAEPPLNLSLSERPGGARARAGVAHFGIELQSVAAVEVETRRLERAGLSARCEETTCCFARQAKAWVADPDGNEWEFFVVLADSEVHSAPAPEGPCCAPTCCATSEG